MGFCYFLFVAYHITHYWYYNFTDFLQESYERAKTILKNRAREHKALADALMKYETLDADDIKAILDGRPVTKDMSWKLCIV